jgi:hypothetical protein
MERQVIEVTKWFLKLSCKSISKAFLWVFNSKLNNKRILFCNSNTILFYLDLSCVSLSHRRSIFLWRSFLMASRCFRVSASLLEFTTTGRWLFRTTEMNDELFSSFIFINLHIIWQTIWGKKCTKTLRQIVF